MFETLNKPQGQRKLLTVSDGLLTGADVRRIAADFRAQETIHAMTDRIMLENNCSKNEKAAGQGDSSKNYSRPL